MNQLVVLSEQHLIGWDKQFIERKIMQFGVFSEQILWLTLGGLVPPDSVVLALGERCLQATTGKQGIDKWQASILGSIIPCYDIRRLNKEFSLQVWISLSCQKAAQLFKEGKKEQKYVFHLNPPLEETLALLRGPYSSAQNLSVDIETGRGQINTVGFALSPNEGIAINVLPDRLGGSAYFELWSAIRDLVSGDQGKILQNFIYEDQYFSRYGVRLRNVIHDTMVCQKFLWPELEMGLHASGRLYADLPYWKDDGKNWNDIRDWRAHYEYNCKDTVGTYQVFLGQQKDLHSRGLTEFHQQYLTRLYAAVSEMCARGIPLSVTRLNSLRSSVLADYEGALGLFQSSPGAQGVNPKSPKQLLTHLKSKGYAVPKRYDSKTKSYKESTDEKSLKKLRLKHPEDSSLDQLLKLSKLGKALSSYLNFTYDADCRMRYSLNVCGTETGRWSGGTDPWDHGVNPQTVPAGNKGINIRSVFEAPTGREFLEIDLRQAESRFVAYDSADLNLIQTLEDPGRDIHWEVALKILESLGKNAQTLSPAEKKFWRQLGKKSGHGANYSMKEQTFIDSCLGEMNIILSKAEATKILEAYHELYPGIRRWHKSLRDELCQLRMLKTPLGRERYFYGRMDEATFREAYAYRPQSTIPDVMNHLMLHLMKLREAGRLEFSLLLQCHDSILMELPEGTSVSIKKEAELLRNWHPRIMLAGGELLIPVEAKCGKIWGDLKVMGESDVEAHKKVSL